MPGKPRNPRPEDLTLPVFKVIEKPEHMTSEEKMALQDNDPVAGTEFREMATLFLQMHDIICACSARDHNLKSAAGNALTEEHIRILQARIQALVDNTHNFTRPLRR